MTPISMRYVEGLQVIVILYLKLGSLHFETPCYLNLRCCNYYHRGHLSRFPRNVSQCESVTVHRGTD